MSLGAFMLPWRRGREAQSAPNPSGAGQATVDPTLPPEPPFGIYVCASPKCGYIFVHDHEGWFYVYDYESAGRNPLGWGRSRRGTWEITVEGNGDCFRRPLIPVKAYGE